MNPTQQLVLLLKACMKRFIEPDCEILLPHSLTMMGWELYWFQIETLIGGPIVTDCKDAEYLDGDWPMIWFNANCEAEPTRSDHGMGIVLNELNHMPIDAAELARWTSIRTSGTLRKCLQISVRDLMGLAGTELLALCSLIERLEDALPDGHSAHSTVQGAAKLLGTESDELLTFCFDLRDEPPHTTSAEGMDAMAASLSTRLSRGDGEEFEVVIADQAVSVKTGQAAWGIKDLRTVKPLCGPTSIGSDSAVWFRTSFSNLWQQVDQGGYGFLMGRPNQAFYSNLGGRSYLMRTIKTGDKSTEHLLAPLLKILSGISGYNSKRATGMRYDRRAALSLAMSLAKPGNEVTIWCLT